jgi:hypothetical protein
MLTFTNVALIYITRLLCFAQCKCNISPRLLAYKYTFSMRRSGVSLTSLCRCWVLPSTTLLITVRVCPFERSLCAARQLRYTRLGLGLGSVRVISLWGCGEVGSISRLVILCRVCVVLCCYVYDVLYGIMLYYVVSLSCYVMYIGIIWYRRYIMSCYVMLCILTYYMVCYIMLLSCYVMYMTYYMVSCYSMSCRVMYFMTYYIADIMLYYVV